MLLYYRKEVAGLHGMIYNQNNIPRTQWRYGLRSSAATGCGWIATYNALRLMDYYAEPERLIRWYERSFPLINGNFGTFLFSPVMFFKRKGFRVRLVFDRQRFDSAVWDSDASILFYYWRRKYRIGSHFVAVCCRDGKFMGYNTFRGSMGADDYGASLAQFLKKQGFFLTVLIALRDTERGRRCG